MMEPVRLRAYSSHIPMLMALAHELAIRRVIEFGSGVYSTKTFLDKKIYPHLTYLLTYENIEKWYRRLSSEVSDPRLDYRFYDGQLADVVPELSLNEFDLVFLDDSKTSADRIATIEAVTSIDLSVPVVIHDYQYPGYRRAAELRFEHSMVYDRIERAHCGLLWSGDVIAPRAVDRISAYLDQLLIEIE
jgi:hypothetical protein